MKKFIQNFKEFAFKGNMIDLAVGMMIGTAFGKIVTSLVNDMFMPLIGLILGKVDFTNLFISLDGEKYATLAEAQEAGAACFCYGNFITALIDFLMIALVIYLFISLIGKFKKPEVKEDPRLCPFCKSEIDKEATRCPHCTSELPVENK